MLSDNDTDPAEVAAATPVRAAGERAAATSCPRPLEVPTAERHGDCCAGDYRVEHIAAAPMTAAWG